MTVKKGPYPKGPFVFCVVRTLITLRMSRRRQRSASGPVVFMRKVLPCYHRASFELRIGVMGNKSLKLVMAKKSCVSLAVPRESGFLTASKCAMP